MGLFDSKWIVEFEFSNGILSSNKKGSIVVEASSEYSAKDKAKAVLKAQYSYVKILSAHKSGGKSEKRNTTYSPKVTISESPKNETYRAPQRELTSEERESLLEEIRQRDELEKQRKILNVVERKKKALKKAYVFHIRVAITSGIISLIAFLVGFIPYWYNLIAKAASEKTLQEWIELGHKETDSYGQELVADIAKYDSQAASIIWLPFVILGIGIIVTIFLFFLAKKKVPSKIEKAEKELKEATDEYESTYGKI